MSTDADSLMKSAARAAKKGPPPVHLWNPPFCGDIDMRIARDGAWFYMGTPIGRPAMVKLFSSILKKEGDAYFLVTPVEKVGIIVDDAPFVAVDFTVSGEGEAQEITFATHVGDSVTAGPDHAIRVETGADGEPAPYIHVRAGLEALIDRKSFYRLVELGEEQDGWFGVRSGGAFFPMIDAGQMQG
ncbi:DUF1285 domain-containing protein [Mangrovicoccus ximenensis]|uniref:DUF1285 domain-containing protein n=1 Tax=Mangrovicoccus ximenensis TaxID=1911570 RepID=UPI000D3BA541|nr:DUF1285 domain-containing protein [Mangrovicoccus ximenensis]